MEKKPFVVTSEDQIPSSCPLCKSPMPDFQKRLLTYTVVTRYQDVFAHETYCSKCKDALALKTSIGKDFELKIIRFFDHPKGLNGSFTGASLNISSVRFIRNMAIHAIIERNSLQEPFTFTKTMVLELLGIPTNRLDAYLDNLIMQGIIVKLPTNRPFIQKVKFSKVMVDMIYAFVDYQQIEEKTDRMVSN